MRTSMLLLTLLLLSSSADAARHGFIIGNGNYPSGSHFKSFNYPLNDADGVEQLIKSAPFNFQSIKVLKDANKPTLDTQFQRFLERLNKGDSVLLYFSGHGVQVEGYNYLIPTGRRFSGDPIEVKYHAINANEWIERIQNRIGFNGTQIAILDACRNDLTKGGGHAGLSSNIGAGGALIAYAASPGKLALAKGIDGYSLYTGHLLKVWREAIHQPVEKVFKQTRRQVAKATAYFQIPWTGGNLLNEFCLHPPCGNGGGSSGDGIDPILPELADLKGGCYMMGQSDAEKAWLKQRVSDEDYAARYNDERYHMVCVEPVQMATKEVTVREFTRFVDATNYVTDAEKGANPGCYIFTDGAWKMSADHNWRNPNPHQANQMNHPVACVSHNDANAYIDWLNQHSSSHYRLPTEAEWEFAARGGNSSAYFWSNDVDSKACDYANVVDQKYWSNAFPCDDGYQYSAPVGSYKPNAYGLYDISGNLWEWTSSTYNSGYDGSERKIAKKGDSGFRVLRGGSWYNDPEGLRAAVRVRYSPDFRGYAFGFRLLRAAP